MAPTWDAIFTNLDSGLVLDIQNGSVRQNGALTQQYGFHGRFNQQFQLFNPFNPSIYFIGTVAEEPSNRTKLSVPAFCLDVAGASTAEKAPIQVFGYHGGPNQQFTIEPVPQGQSDFFQIVSVHSGKCVNVADASHEQQALVQQFHFFGGNNQIWRWVKPQDMGPL
jgi:Ricin-type beta-trefoil lectin domain